MKLIETYVDNGLIHTIWMTNPFTGGDLAYTVGTKPGLRYPWDVYSLEPRHIDIPNWIANGDIVRYAAHTIVPT